MGNRNMRRSVNNFRILQFPTQRESSVINEIGMVSLQIINTYY